MTIFRKVVLALAVTALLGTSLASAQPSAFVSCTVFSVIPFVRAEGLTELTGDIRLECRNTQGGIPADGYIVTNFSVALNTNITNTRGFGATAGDGPNPPSSDNTTDAVLVINENNYDDPTRTSTFRADALFTDIPVPQYGERISNTLLTWNGVQVPSPNGCRIAGCASDPFDNIPDADRFPIVTQLRWNNIRANASLLGVPGVDQFPTTQVFATISNTSNTSIGFTQNNVPVAAPLRGLDWSLRLTNANESVGDSLSSPITALQCVEINIDDDDLEDGSGNEGNFYVRLDEGFATAFKTIGVPTFTTISQTRPFEAGYCTPGSGTAPAVFDVPGNAGSVGLCAGGGATQGTRFIIRFFNVPDGVRIGVDDCVGNLAGDPATGDLEIKRIDGASSSGSGGNLADSCDGLDELDVSGGFAYAVYEVIDNNPSVDERVDVKVTIGFEPDTENDEPSVGTMQVQADFAPLSTAGTSQKKGDLHLVPRFIETGAPRSVFSIIKCNTTILFPFVTNQAGFDTGIAISNTSKDWLGTTPQNGTCTIHYHGETTGGGAAPPDQTSVVINGGEQLIFTLSGGNTDQGIAGAPDFQGYVIAVCEFQFGHGYAFITDGFGGIPNLAQGYLALIIETIDGKRLLATLNSGGSESLGH